MAKLPKRNTTRLKYKKIQMRYADLYHEKRIRHDDVISQLCEEFFISEPNTINRILCTPIKPEDLPGKHQMELFGSE